MRRGRDLGRVAKTAAGRGVVVTAVAVLLRQPIADLISVPEAWARPPRRSRPACLWLLLSVERGALQGVHAYKPVGVVDRARGARAARASG